MKSKDRAINLGLKINSLKGNLSVAKSVIDNLEIEICNASIEEDDRKKLFVLYKEVVKELNSFVSPSTAERSRFNQIIEDTLIKIIHTKSYKEIEQIDGIITGIEEDIASNKIIDKEQKSALKSRSLSLREKYKAQVGHFLKKNFEKLKRDIQHECDCDNPFHVSIVVKKYNGILKTEPLFNDDRHFIQALLDTNWQQSSRDIKEVKSLEKERND